VVVPVFLALVVGTIEFGRAFMAEDLICNASRAGARVGALPGTSSDTISSAVNSALQSTGVSSPNASVTILVNGYPADAVTAVTGDSITVTVSVPATDVSWLPTSWFLGNASLTGTTVMRRE
jgi:Flp pilus assembly protein TadG